MADESMPQTPLRSVPLPDATDLHDVALDESASRTEDSAPSREADGGAATRPEDDGERRGKGGDEEAAVTSSSTRPSTPPPHGGGNEGSEVSHAPRASPGTQSQRVALFDLDLTLLDVNTGRLWVEKEFREGKVPFGLYLLAVYWFAKYAAGLGIDAGEVAREAMGHYKGISDAAMTQEVEAFWNLECAHRLRPGAAAALAAHRAAGDRCVLCTASWQHIAAAARRSFALDGAICSFIEVGAEGTFTGAVVDAYGDGKWRRTLEWAQAEGVDLANCTFYTDSYSDMRLMQAVGTPVAVCPDSRLADAARKSGWRIEDWGHAPMQANAAKQRYQCSILGITNGCM